MCLAVPGRIIDVEGAEAWARSGRVAFGEIVRRVNLACVPAAGVGDYVLVHAGLAISIVDEQEAQRTLQCLRELDSVRAGEGPTA